MSWSPVSGQRNGLEPCEWAALSISRLGTSDLWPDQPRPGAQGSRHEQKFSREQTVSTLCIQPSQSLCFHPNNCNEPL